jgi:DNA-binding response OmpR family regulator
MRGRKILLADHDMAAMLKIYFGLSHKKFPAEVCDDIMELLPFIKRLKPDIVIISTSLPGLTDELCRKIRDQYQVKIVLMHEKEELSAKENLIADDSIEKPVDVESLIKKIRKLIWGARKKA